MFKKNILDISCVVCGLHSVFGLSIQVGSKAIFLPMCGFFFKTALFKHNRLNAADLVIHWFSETNKNENKHSLKRYTDPVAKKISGKKLLLKLAVL